MCGIRIVQEFGDTSTEQWRLVPDSIEPNFVNTAFAKLGPNSHFKVSNVNILGKPLFRFDVNTDYILS